MDTHARLSLRIPTASIPSESSPHGRLAARIIPPTVSMPSLWITPSQSSPLLPPVPRGILRESSQLPYFNEIRGHGNSADQFTPPASDSNDETRGEFSSHSQIFGVCSSDSETSSSPPSPPYCRKQGSILRDGYGEEEFSRDFSGTSRSNTVEFSGTSSASCGEEKSDEEEREEEVKGEGEDSEGCSTPRTMEFQIPKLCLICPPAPRKRQRRHSKTSSPSMSRLRVRISNSGKKTVPSFFVVPDFTAFFPPISAQEVSSEG